MGILKTLVIVCLVTIMFFVMSVDQRKRLEEGIAGIESQWVKNLSCE